MLVEISNLFDLLSKEGLLNDPVLVHALSSWATNLPDDVDRDCISGELGIRIARLGMFDCAESLVRTIVSAHEKPQYMRRVSESEMEAGSSARAVSLLREAIRATESMPSNWYWEKAEVLAYIALVLHRAGDSSAAAEQWDAAINVAKAGEQADPKAVDCSAVLWTISKMLTRTGQHQKAQVVASGIMNEDRRRGALGDLEKP